MVQGFLRYTVAATLLVGTPPATSELVRPEPCDEGKPHVMHALLVAL